MRKLWLLSAFSFGAGSLFAQLPTCPNTDTLADLISKYSSSACISQDKMFWGFSYAPTGTNSPPASQVMSSLIFQTSPAVDIHGWSFTGDWEQAGANLASFTLSYEIQVCNAPSCASAVLPGEVISAADAIYAPSALTGAGNETVSWSNGASTTLTSSSPGPLPVGANIGFSGAGPITVTANFSGTGVITGTSLRFYESQVPEPTAAGYVLGVLSIFAIAGYRRWKPKTDYRP